MKRIIKWVGSIVALGVAVVVWCNVAVSCNARGRVYDRAEEVPHTRVALLLATSPVTPAGARNHYFDNRIIAADSLFKLGKIDYLIASGGDYRVEGQYGYDEPVAIRDSLVARGVAADRIILDHEGTRTLNSLAKVKRNGLDSIIIISQKDHNERAIRIADHLGIHAIAYNAKPSHIRRLRIKNHLREYLARVKMYIDFWTRPIPETQAYDFPKSSAKNCKL